MAYDNIITRNKVEALIPTETADGVLTKVAEDSAALSLFRNVQMSREQMRMPVLSALPVAYFVNGDTGLKQTTEMNWANRYLDVEEIAVIVPIPDNVIDDTSFDVWGAIRPLIEEAFGRTLDAAIFFGIDKPNRWPKAIVEIANDAGNVVERGTHTPAEGGIEEDFNEVFAGLDESGFDADQIIASRRLKQKLRGARDVDGNKMEGVSATAVLDTSISYPMRGLWPTGALAPEAIAGDFSQGIIGIRKDLTYKLLDQAVIQGADGQILYNLAQQDMTAMRVVGRFAFAMSNVVNFDQPVEELRSPFGVLVSPSA